MVDLAHLPGTPEVEIAISSSPLILSPLSMSPQHSYSSGASRGGGAGPSAPHSGPFDGTTGCGNSDCRGRGSGGAGGAGDGNLGSRGPGTVPHTLLDWVGQVAHEEVGLVLVIATVTQSAAVDIVHIIRQ